MTARQWDPSLETGDPVVDAEHRDIYSLVSELQRAATSGTDRGVVEGAISRILSYSRNHFEHEEALMQRIGFPDLERQRALHREFSETAEQLADDYLHGVSMSAEGLARFMREWFETHIDTEDRRIVEHLRRVHEAF